MVCLEQGPKSTIKIRHGISFGFLRDFGKGAISSATLEMRFKQPGSTPVRRGHIA
ncbi:hypothetical protein MBAV_000201 [Candidatus Magnetobacterium bavaricum]|uniref:Uncharacterized protein n=1 Tax=Candidatus Magnetobacterium bavaricum TaxID=29290 RepID=A0A0F3H0B2_9BACT|nr:hypothetical protein MBAV_000201 [Candidatus Magnetobacterium bavaricum]